MEAVRDIRLHKPEPRIVSKEKRDKAIEAERVSVKRDVFARHRGRCRVCFGQAHELHEVRFRSLGGKRSLQNSIAVCNYQGANCHRLLQTLVIAARFVQPTIGALGWMEFERDGRVSRSLPGEKPVKHARSWQRD